MFQFLYKKGSASTLFSLRYLQLKIIAPYRVLCPKAIIKVYMVQVKLNFCLILISPQFIHNFLFRLAQEDKGNIIENQPGLKILTGN